MFQCPLEKDHILPPLQGRAGLLVFLREIQGESFKGKCYSILCGFRDMIFGMIRPYISWGSPKNSLQSVIVLLGLGIFI